MAKKSVEAFDASVGARLRGRRLQFRMSQAELGRALGVSYQQIQKYESGANRLTGAALVEACAILRLNVEQLLREPEFADCRDELQDSHELLEHLRRIQSGPLRVRALRLIEALAGLSEMQRAQAALAGDVDLLGALPFAIYTTNAGGALTYFNEAAAAFAGRRPRIMQDRWCVTWRLYSFDGTYLPHENCPMAVALKEDRPIRDVRAIAERPDGSRRCFTPHPTPLHNASGALIGGINLLLDHGAP
jgi:transcriptional regulator with XRE-family HTH domain